MRLGGLNGYVVITSADGSTYNLPDLPTYIDQVFTRPSILQYEPFDPVQRRAEMITFANDWCSLNAGVACAGFSVSAVIDAAIQKIIAARASGVPTVNGGGTYYPDAQQACSAGYVLASNGNCVAKPTNTLSNTAPQTTTVYPTQPTTSLTPPPPQQTPTMTQIVNSQTVAGATLTNTAGGFEAANAWFSENWKLVAAGVAALVVLPMVLGGRR